MGIWKLFLHPANYPCPSLLEWQNISFPVTGTSESLDQDKPLAYKILLIESGHALAYMVYNLIGMKYNVKGVGSFGR